nr:hypothetical protein [Russula griseocarnosa]
MSILPFSIDKISKIEDLENKAYYLDPNSNRKFIHLSEDIKNLLDELDDNYNYLISLSLISNINDYEEGDPLILLSDSIVINKYSSYTLIKKFIFNQLDLLIDKYPIDPEILIFDKSRIILHYTKIIMIE